MWNGPGRYCKELEHSCCIRRSQAMKPKIVFPSALSPLHTSHVIWYSWENRNEIFKEDFYLFERWEKEGEKILNLLFLFPNGCNICGLAHPTPGSWNSIHVPHVVAVLQILELSSTGFLGNWIKSETAGLWTGAYVGSDDKGSHFSLLHHDTCPMWILV